MIKTLPFPALRAFEAVVRLEGFGRAADELGITQSAVSQHVRMLEEWTGQVLLVRGARRSCATDNGMALAEAVATGIGGIGKVCARLRSQGRENRTITVSCLPGFALNWLFPRLIDFDEAHPELSVSISTNATPVTFATGNEDIAIRYGMGNYPNIHVEKLMDERLFPVCAPMLLSRGGGIRHIADMASQTMLVDDVSPINGHAPTWSFWAKATGQTLPQPRRTRRFGQSNMVVQAAVKGLGVALGREPLVMDALKDGSLCRPFGQSAESEFSYWFVCPRPHLDSSHIVAFRDWLMEVAGAPYTLPDIVG